MSTFSHLHVPLCQESHWSLSVTNWSRRICCPWNRPYNTNDIPSNSWSMRRCFTSVSCKMLELVIYHHVFIHCEDYKTRGRAKLSQLIVMLGDQLQGADAHEQRLTYTNSRFQQNIWYHAWLLNTLERWVTSEAGLEPGKSVIIRMWC